MSIRTRTVLGPVGRACGLCGADRVALVESRRVRRLADRFNASWDPQIRLTETCRACGARTRVDNVVASLPHQSEVLIDTPASADGIVPIS
jgi:hypothetical protein